MEYSVNSLSKFLDYLAEKGLTPKATAVSRKAACNKMLGILSSEEASDLRSVNLDDLAIRFHNLEGMKYTSDSLKTYKSRVSKSIDDFLRYKENPLNFKIKQTAPKRPSVKLSNAESSVDLPADNASASSLRENAIERHQAKDSHNTISIPIPIRDNLIVHISDVPFDLEKSEAQKIANVVLALAGMTMKHET